MISIISQNPIRQITHSIKIITNFAKKANFNFLNNSNSKLIKKYISFKMEPLENKPTQSKRLVSPEEEQELNKLLVEMKVTENNIPEVPVKNVKVTSFGGRIRVAALLGSDGEKWIGKLITIGGWARTVRQQGKGEIAFIEINDGSTIKGIQIVVDKSLPNYAEVIKEGIGSCFQIRGLVVKSIGSKQLIEVQVNGDKEHFVKILGSCDQGEYPLIKSKDRMKLETLREICHLRPRTNTISVVARIRNNLAYATHLFFQNRGFLYIHTPIITGADCEGAGEMFQVTTVLPKPHKKVNLNVTKEGLVDYTNDFFGKPSYLTVSGQLAVENYACALSDVYTFGPTFRAEFSYTSRHLAEFWMIEPEICFADIFDDMECAESYLKFCLKYVLENNQDDFAFLEAQIEKGITERLKNVIDNQFKRVPYTEAIEILQAAVAKDKNLFKTEAPKRDKKKEKAEKKEKKDQAKKQAEAKKDEGAKVETTGTEEKKSEVIHCNVEVSTSTTENTTSTSHTINIHNPTEIQVENPNLEKKKEEVILDKRNIYWGMDLASDHERYLTETVFKQPIILYNYPKQIKSFYMRQNEDGKTVAAMDILVPKIGEIIGGSQREERLEVLEKRLEELNMDKKSYWWYLELRKYGSVPHAGFGLGFERLVMMATGLENIRDVIPFPRYPGHSEF